MSGVISSYGRADLVDCLERGGGRAMVAGAQQAGVGVLGSKIVGTR